MLLRTFVAATALLLGSLSLPACDTGATEETPESNEAVAAAATDAATDAAAEAGAADAAAGAGETPAAIGAALAEGTALTPVADLLAKPEEMLGKTVRIQGQAVQRCGSGCSMTLADGDAKLMVRAKKGEFEFPAGWKDQTVVVEGIFELNADCDDHHEGEHEAKADGEGPHKGEHEGKADGEGPHKGKHEGKADGEGPHKGEHQHHAEAHGEQAEVTYTIQVSGAKIAG